jgi:hypothetical protein
MTLQGTLVCFRALLNKNDAYHARAVYPPVCVLLMVLGFALQPLGPAVQAQPPKQAGKPPEDVWSVAVSQDGPPPSRLPISR